MCTQSPRCSPQSLPIANGGGRIQIASGLSFPETLASTRGGALESPWSTGPARWHAFHHSTHQWLHACIRFGKVWRLGLPIQHVAYRTSLCTRWTSSAQKHSRHTSCWCYIFLNWEGGDYSRAFLPFSKAAAVMQESGATGKFPSVPSLRAERRFSVKEAEASDELLNCIEDGDIQDLHGLLSSIPGGVTSVLNTPSLLVKHKMRTPLMAAAATGDFAKFTATLYAFDRQFPNKLERDFEMRTQMTNRDRKGMTAAMLAARSANVATLELLLQEIEDTGALMALEMHDHKRMTLLMHACATGPAPVFQEVHRALNGAFGNNDDEFGRQLLLRSADDRTILMHAAASGDSMVLKMVADACRKNVRPQMLRAMIVERDSDGLNLLMHAASCSAPSSALAPAKPSPADPAASDTKDAGAQAGAPPQDVNSSAKPSPTKNFASTLTGSSVGAEKDASGDAKTAVERMVEADEGPKHDMVVVPVFKVAVRLVKECLWKDEVLEQLKAIDLWGRSVLTHALLSGHEMMFEAAYGAVRDDIQDEQVSEMMETNEGEREDTPMIDALARGPSSMRKLYALRAGQLKKDVDARSKLSSMNAKIESFIPGKLVVMFQLLLPQIAEGRQLILLYIMCAIAPMMKLATSTVDPDSKHPGVAPRSNKLSVVLGAPAMFFWGVGTSTVGTTGLGWSSSLSATSMAAATLAIPAVDSFFNSRKAYSLGDKICCNEWRFNWKAYWTWRKTRSARVKSSPPQSELPSYSTFGGGAAAVTSPGIEEEKRSTPHPGGMAALSTGGEEFGPTPTPILTPHESPKDSSRLSEKA